jgi:hypothetical protein
VDVTTLSLSVARSLRHNKFAWHNQPLQCRNLQANSFRGQDVARWSGRWCPVCDCTRTDNQSQTTLGDGGQGNATYLPAHRLSLLNLKRAVGCRLCVIFVAIGAVKSVVCGNAISIKRITLNQHSTKSTMEHGADKPFICTLSNKDWSQAIEQHISRDMC